MTSKEKAIELCKKYAEASEYYDDIIKGDWAKMPAMAKQLVNQCANEILSLLQAENTQLKKASDKLGAWMSAALEDENVCEEMKIDIRGWFEALGE